MGYLVQLIKNLCDFRIREIVKSNRTNYSKQQSKAFIFSMILIGQYDNILGKIPQFLIKLRNKFDKFIKKMDLEPFKSVFRKKIPVSGDFSCTNK